MLTEEEMITLVEQDASRRACQRGARHAQLMHDEPIPFLLRLGLVIGVIDEAMVARTESATVRESRLNGLNQSAESQAKGQEPTEADRDRNSEDDLDLICAVLHNASLAGIENPRPRIKRSCNEVTSTRCTSEELIINVDHCDQALQFMVCNPHLDDVSDEMTAIYLSRHEVQALRTLLNCLEW